MTRNELRVFRYGLLFGILVLAGALVFTSLSFGTMSSPQYGSAFEFVESRLTPLDGAVPPLTPSRTMFLDDGAGSVGVYAWFFDTGLALNQSLRFHVVPPRWRKFGANSVPIGMVSPEDSTLCNFKLCVEFALLEIAKPVPPVTAKLCEVFSSGGSTAPIQVTLDSVPGVSTTLDPVLHGRLFRDRLHDDDTCNDLGVGLWAHTVGVAFEKDRPGSRTALSK
jgi:hypothetical protein